MDNQNSLFPRICHVGDSALLVEFADELSPAANDRVYALDARLHQAPLTGVVEWVPAYASLLVIYDPISVKLPDVRQWLVQCMNAKSPDQMYQPKRVMVPVRYGGAAGPDLNDVADFHGLSPGEVVERHAAQVYRVGMMGFTPGFAYLLGLDPSLATPRHSTPRTEVPAGSVGIAGGQTGIYPIESPGGWQLIGRTDQMLFDPDHEPHFLFSPGDEVQFIPVEDGAVS